MTNLFIIGNGFDLSHGLKTSFSDFRQYLCTLTPAKSLSYYNVGNFIKEDRDGEEYINTEDIIAFTVNLYDSICSTSPLWSDLEISTANIDFSQWLNDEDLGYRDKEGDINPWATEENYKSQVKGLNFVIPALPILIRHWINTISLSKISYKQSFQNIISGKDNLFFSFNYTPTLEELYKIPSEKICHIHGKCEKDNTNKLPYKFILNAYDSEHNYHIKVGHNTTFDFKFGRDFHYHGIAEIVSDIANSLNKDIPSNIAYNQDFFSKLSNSNIKHIYSYGFSYSNIDQDYVKEIIKNIDNDNVIWHFNNYDLIHNSKYLKILRHYGYKGCIAQEPFMIE